MPPTITQAYPPLPLDELTAAIANLPSASTSKKTALISRLVEVHPILSLRWGPGWRYRRARLLGPTEIPATVDEIIWRTGTPAALGRANAAGFQVLYLADRADTAFCEVKANDSPALLAEFSILATQNVLLAPVGELAQIQRTGRGYLSGDCSSIISKMLNACTLDEAKSLLITDSFLLECLTNVDDDYELSSCVAMKIFDKLPSISAIAYPSRRRFGALNFAVRTEDFWAKWGVRAVRRGRAVHLAQGYYKFTDIRHVTGVMAGGFLKWGADVDVENSAVHLDPPWTP